MSATASLRILLLSGYDAASHRLWHENLARMMPEHEWTPLALAPRNFSWRLRGNALIFAFGERETTKSCRYQYWLVSNLNSQELKTGFY